MARITDEIKQIAEKAKLWAVGTTNKNIPNVVPIYFTKVISENKILLVNNFMKKTRKNLEENPNVAVSVWITGEKSKGYQFKGEAKILTQGKLYEEGVKMVKSEEPGLMPKSVILINVKSIYDITPGPNAGNEIK